MRVTARIGLALGLLALAGAPVGAEEKGTLTNAQKDEIRELVRDYLVENPEVISDAINALQAKEDKAREDKQSTAVRKHKQDIFDAADGTILGNPKGDVTLVEFFDYNCGYCKSFFPQLMDAIKQDGKVRVIMKEFPILGPSSLTAARAALAARKQNKYAEFHMALLSHKGAITDGAVMDVAADVGLDIKKLQSDMTDPAITTTLSKNRSLAQELSIDGTPALVVGDTLVPGAVSRARLTELIAAARR